MATLYITSTETFSGKSALCIGLAKRMRRDGLSVGYLKPLSAGPRLAAGLVDEDAEFFRQTLELSDPIEDMAPVGISPAVLEQFLKVGGADDFRDKLWAAYERTAKGRDVVILEGGSSLREGYAIGLPSPLVAQLLDARVLAIIHYDEDLQVMDDLVAAQVSFGDRFIGAVLNGVPRQRMPFAQEVAKQALEARGLPVYAVLPQERLLLSISVSELAELLAGEILCCADRADELVEHLMVGAMGVDSALTYFRRKPNKAVITGGDRPDIQLAALETSTKCLILTGNLQPSPIIIGRAAEVGVPMILVKQDTLTAVEVIERYFGKTRIHQAKKIERFEQMLEDRFDFERLYAALDLRRKE